MTGNSEVTLAIRNYNRNKSSPGSPHIRLSIAECSLLDLLQVELLIGASEKTAGRSQPSLLESVLCSPVWRARIAKKWAEFAHSVENKGKNSLQCRTSGGEAGIRTYGTGLKPVRTDVCVSCAESTSSKILRTTGRSPINTLSHAGPATCREANGWRYCG